MKKIQISIIIPVYNNAYTLNELVSKIQVSLSKFDISYEIIFINDFSKDNSNDVLEKLTNKVNVSLIDNIKNIGQQKSILKGISLSTGESILVMDADLQDDPKYIPELYNSLNDHVDAVFALRNGKYQENKKLFTSFLFKSISMFLSGLHKKAGTFFIINNQLRNELLKLNCRNVYSTFMVACIAKERIAYVDVIRNSRKLGKSEYSLAKRTKVAFLGIACILECRYKLLFQKK